MCLDTVYRGKQKKVALAKLPENGYYWKVAMLIDGVYWPENYNDKPFKVGWNVTKSEPRQEDYAVGYHLLRHKTDAEIWNNYNDEIIRCKVDKKNIINIGIQDFCDTDLLTIVTTRFWCPKPRR